MNEITAVDIIKWQNTLLNQDYKLYKEWRDREIKKGRGKRFPPTYYEKIEQDK